MKDETVCGLCGYWTDNGEEMAYAPYTDVISRKLRNNERHED